MYCVEELLSRLKMCQELRIELKKCQIFTKLSSLNKFGDLVSVCCTDSNKEILETELQQLIEESQRDLLKVSVVSFSINENRIYLKLDWLSTVKSVFIDIFECQTTYGCSNKFYNKAIRLCYGVSENQLTALRMRTAGNVVSGLVALGGGSVTDSADAHSTVHISPSPGSSVLVGSVHIAGSTDTSQANYLLFGNTVNHVFKKIIGKVVYVFTACVFHPLCSTNNIIRLRRTELQDRDHKDLSEQSVEQLVSATVVFDLLSVNLSKPLVLNSSIVPRSASRSNCKGATFVLYNYVRVCAILDRFEDKVSKRVYKPLSSFHDLDYSLLLKEEEWRLVFDFLAEWPSVVAECQDLSRPKLHKIVAFLSSLASTFSVFYKYNRVLNVRQITLS